MPKIVHLDGGTTTSPSTLGLRGISTPLALGLAGQLRAPLAGSRRRAALVRGNRTHARYFPEPIPPSSPSSSGHPPWTH